MAQFWVVLCYMHICLKSPLFVAATKYCHQGGGQGHQEGYHCRQRGGQDHQTGDHGCQGGDPGCQEGGQGCQGGWQAGRRHGGWQGSQHTGQHGGGHWCSKYKIYRSQNTKYQHK